MQINMITLFRGLIFCSDEFLVGLAAKPQISFVPNIPNKHCLYGNPLSFELYLKVVFKGKGGVSTGRLLAAVNRPH